MKTALIFLIFALGSVYTAAQNVPQNYTEAMNYCTTTPLDAIEGIWEFVDDHVTVMLLRENMENPPAYGLYIIDSSEGFADCGQRLGKLLPTSVSGTYELQLCTKLSKGKLSGSTRCVGKLSADKQSMSVEMPEKSFEWTFIPTAILPKLSRLIRVKPKTKAAQLPKGFVKLHPILPGSYNEIIYL